MLSSKGACSEAVTDNAICCTQAPTPCINKAGSPHHLCVGSGASAAHLCHQLPLLQVVSHQDRNDLAAEHKVQHGRALGHKAPYAGAVEVDVDQVLQGSVALHLNAQAAPEGAAGAVGDHEVGCLNQVVLALRGSNSVMLMSLTMLMPQLSASFRCAALALQHIKTMMIRSLRMLITPMFCPP